MYPKLLIETLGLWDGLKIFLPSLFTLLVTMYVMELKHRNKVRLWKDNRIELIDVKLEAIIYAMSKIGGGIGGTWERHYKDKYKDIVDELEFRSKNESNRS